MLFFPGLTSFLVSKDAALVDAGTLAPLRPDQLTNLDDHLLVNVGSFTHDMDQAHWDRYAATLNL